LLSPARRKTAQQDRGCPSSTASSIRFGRLSPSGFAAHLQSLGLTGHTPLYRRRDRHGDDDDGEPDEGGTDRLRQEDCRIATRNQHGAAEILLHHRSKDEPQYEGSGLAVEFHEHIADDTECGGKPEVEAVEGKTENADRGEGD